VFLQAAVSVQAPANLLAAAAAAVGHALRERDIALLQHCQEILMVFSAGLGKNPAGQAVQLCIACLDALNAIAWSLLDGPPQLRDADGAITAQIHRILLIALGALRSSQGGVSAKTRQSVLEAVLPRATTYMCSPRADPQHAAQTTAAGLCEEMSQALCDLVDATAFLKAWGGSTDHHLSSKKHTAADGATAGTATEKRAKREDAFLDAWMAPWVWLEGYSRSQHLPAWQLRMVSCLPMYAAWVLAFVAGVTARAKPGKESLSQLGANLPGQQDPGARSYVWKMCEEMLSRSVRLLLGLCESPLEPTGTAREPQVPTSMMHAVKLRSQVVALATVSDVLKGCRVHKVRLPHAQAEFVHKHRAMRAGRGVMTM
jgi:hypothetical protein